jgi:ADP-ribosylglycohydrolase
MKNKFRGLLVGSAVGDSLGMCVEELPKEEVHKFYGDEIRYILDPHPSSPACFQKAGETSSEFEIIKMVAKSLVERKMLDVKDIIKKYIEFEENEAIHNYVDTHFLMSIRNIKMGLEPETTGTSIEGALPAIPIGAYHFINPILAVEGTKAVVMITHKNQYILDVASAMAVAVGQLILENYDLEEEYDKFIDMLKEFTTLQETKDYLENVKQLLNKNTDYEEAIYILGNGSFCLEAFSQALFIFLKTPRDTEKVIIKSANSYGDFGGDTDAISLIASAFAGAYNGEETIPPYLKLKLKNYHEIVKLADDLYNVAPKPIN